MNLHIKICFWLMSRFVLLMMICHSDISLYYFILLLLFLYHTFLTVFIATGAMAPSDSIYNGKYCLFSTTATTFI